MSKCIICSREMSNEFDVAGEGWREICTTHGTTKEQLIQSVSVAGIVQESFVRSQKQHREFCENILKQLDLVLKTMDGVGLILHQQAPVNDPWGSPASNSNESGESLLQTTKEQLTALVAQTKKELENGAK